MKKIVIVEDDSMLSEIYQKKFSEAGYEVIAAISGVEAVTKAEEAMPDLMLLDLVLPEVDGFEVLKRIKDNPKTKNIRVVVFSNLSQEEDKQKAADLGAEGFITKSDFTPQEIVIKVNEIIGGASLNASVADSKERGKQKVTETDKKTRAKSGNKDRSMILLVEDEDVFVEVFSKKLEAEGFVVEVAKNGAWGLKKANESKYDLVIIDIVMPAMDGLEAVQKIREGELNKKTPIIVFSNSVDEEEKEKEAIQAGADLFLVKTRVAPSELAVEAKKLIG